MQIRLLGAALIHAEKLTDGRTYRRMHAHACTHARSHTHRQKYVIIIAFFATKMIWRMPQMLRYTYVVCLDCS